MLQYTKATLKDALLLWNRNSAPQFEDELDHIIQKGELDLFRALDLAPMVTSNDTNTTVNAAEVFKPPNLLIETALWVNVGGVKVPLQKRNPAFIRFTAASDGVAEYYCEMDETRWQLDRDADQAYVITVDGSYAPDSITQGGDGQTTYMSTTVPDLLYLACAIQACEFLKFWDHKAALVTEFGAKVATFRGDAPKIENSDAEDLMGDRQQQNPVKGPGA